MNITDILFKDDIGLFVKHKIIQNFAMNLLNIFIPIYFYTLGFSLIQIFLWFFIFTFSSLLLFQYGGVKIAGKIGAKNTVFTASIFYIIFLVLLLEMKSLPIIFFPAAIIYSIWDSFYFVQREALFIGSAKDGYRGFTEGTLSALEQLASVIAISLGAIILNNFGIAALLILVLISFIVSILPVYSMKNSYSRAKIPLKDMFQKENLSLYIKLIARTFQRDALFIFWPVYIFINGIDIISIGFIGAMMFAGSIIASIVSGKLADINHDIIMKLSAAGTIIFWLLLIFAKSDVSLLAVSFALNLFLMSLYLALYTKVSNLGAKSVPIKFAFSTMFIENIGAAILSAAVILALIFSINLKLIFIISSLSSLVFFLKDKH